MNVPRFNDTNVLLYSVSRDPAEAPKRDIAIALLDAEADEPPSRSECHHGRIVSDQGTR